MAEEVCMSLESDLRSAMNKLTSDEIVVLNAFLKSKDVNHLKNTSKKSLVIGFCNFAREIGIKKKYTEEEIDKFLDRGNYSGGRNNRVYFLRKYAFFLGYDPIEDRNHPLLKYSLKFKSLSQISRKKMPTAEDIFFLVYVSKIYSNKASYDPIMFRLYMHIILTTGLRRFEPLSLTPEDVLSIDNKYFYIYVKGKRDKFRKVPIQRELAEELLFYIEVNNIKKNERVFKVLYEWYFSGRTFKIFREYNLFMRTADILDALVQKIPSNESGRFVEYYVRELNEIAVRKLKNKIKKYKVKRYRKYFRPKFHFHQYRAFFASYAHNNLGLSAKEVMVLLGHSSLSTTDRYLRTEEEDVIRKMGAIFEGNNEDEKEISTDALILQEMMRREDRLLKEVKNINKDVESLENLTPEEIKEYLKGKEDKELSSNEKIEEKLISEEDITEEYEGEEPLDSEDILKIKEEDES